MKARSSFVQRAESVFMSVFIVFVVVWAFLTLIGVVALHPPSYAVVVNGEGITVSEVTDTYEQLPAEVRSAYTKEAVLEQLIDKTLILQDASRKGVVVSQEEVDAFIDEQVSAFGISRRQLADTLLQAGISFSEYEQAVHEELVLRSYVDVVIGDVSDPAAAFQVVIADLRKEAFIEYGEEL
ncbi:MAG: SurA N-terminal domain-containing protein [Candidatus Woesearchaeota archaeon]